MGCNCNKNREVFPLFRKIARFFGFGLVKPRLQYNRLNICRSNICEMYDRKLTRCKACGCFL